MKQKRGKKNNWEQRKIKQLFEKGFVEERMWRKETREI
jgi:hypothetical protein